MPKNISVEILILAHAFIDKVSVELSFAYNFFCKHIKKTIYVPFGMMSKKKIRGINK